MTDRPAVRIDRITKSFKDGKNKHRTIYKDMSIDIPSGELFIILGRNGVGKSTLLKTIAGLDKNNNGTIEILGKKPGCLTRKELSSMIAFVSTEIPQINNLSVYDMVGMGRSPYTNWIGKLSPEDDEKIRESIRMVGMESFTHKDITTLSDGERQRIMIARALAQDSEIILLDEPTAFLDIPYKYEIASLLRRLSHEHGKTIVFTTHDLNIALRLADTVCIMTEGKAVYGAPEDIILNGSINYMLKDSPLHYDIYDSEIKLAATVSDTVNLICPEEIRKLLTLALERSGYSVNNNSYATVGVRYNGKVPELSFVTPERSVKFSSVGELLRYLRR